METAEILPLHDQQQRIDLTFPDRRKEVTPEGVVRFVRPKAGMNFISYSRLSAEQAEAVITEQINYFVPIGQPFEWRVFEHDQPADLLARLRAASGCWPSRTTAPGLAQRDIRALRA